MAEELIIELIMELVKEAAMEELNVDDTVITATDVKGYKGLLRDFKRFYIMY